MTSWARAGAVCECIDQEWQDFFIGEEVAGPMLGERYVVASHMVVDGSVFIQPMGSDMCYEAIAFRPVNDVSDDVELFRHLLNNSSAPSRGLEHACSS